MLQVNDLLDHNLRHEMPHGDKLLFSIPTTALSIREGR